MDKIKKFKENEKGSITMTVLFVMIFMLVVIGATYFSISNKSMDQNNKIKKISQEYNVTDEDMEQEYQKLINKLDIENYVKVGDYVNYNPIASDKNGTPIENKESLSYTSPTGTAMQHGNGYTSEELGGGQTFTASGDIKWKVLNVENGTIEEKVE